MDWEKIVEQIPTAIEKVRTDYVLNNMIIKDDNIGEISIEGGKHEEN